MNIIITEYNNTGFITAANELVSGGEVVSPNDILSTTDAFTDVSLVLLDYPLISTNKMKVINHKLREKSYPIIIAIGWDSIPKKVAAVPLGVDLCYSTHISVQEFDIDIAVLLRQREIGKQIGIHTPPDPAKVNVEYNKMYNIKINIANKEFVVDGKSALFTTVEWDLVSILLKNQGMVCTTEMLMNDLRVSKGYLRYLVSTIRNKLGEHGKEIIRSIGGYGAMGYLYDNREEQHE